MQSFWQILVDGLVSVRMVFLCLFLILLYYFVEILLLASLFCGLLNSLFGLVFHLVSLLFNLFVHFVYFIKMYFFSWFFHLIIAFKLFYLAIMIFFIIFLILKGLINLVCHQLIFYFREIVFDFMTWMLIGISLNSMSLKISLNKNLSWNFLILNWMLPIVTNLIF